MDIISDRQTDSQTSDKKNNPELSALLQIRQNKYVYFHVSLQDLEFGT